MKLKRAIKIAVDNQDARMAGRIVDTLRFRFKLDYRAIYIMFKNIAGISEADFEELMHESDSN